MSVKELLQCQAKLASLQRDYERLYCEVTVLRVKVAESKA
jgi:hypothetical protein